MKTVFLDDQGYTADGDWRMVKVEPDQPMIDAARDKYMAWHYACGKEDVPLYYTPSDHFRAMIAASPAPELADAMPVSWLVKYSGNDYCETLDDERKVKQLVKELESCGWIDIRVEPLFTAPSASAVPADWRSIINEFIGEAEQTYCPDSTCGYPDVRCCRESMKRLVDEAKALLQSPAATDNRIAELEARNKELQADAERYRFLRYKTCIISGVFHILNMPNAGDEWRQKSDAGEQLDAAIDAARGVKDGH